MASRARVVIPLLLCLALEGCRSQVDSGWTALVPPDTIALVGIHLRELRETPVYRKLGGQNRLPRFDEFRNTTGIDPDRDIHDLTFAYDGQDGLWIARGTFPVSSSPREGTVTVVDRNIALAGPPQMMRAAIGRYRTAVRSAPAALMSIVDTLPKDSQIWAVTSGWKGLNPENLRRMGNAANLDRVLRTAENTTLSARLSVGLHAAIAADCRNEADAQTLSSQLSALLGLVRSVPRTQPDLLHALDGLQVTQQTRTVRVTADIPEDLLERLLDGAR